MLPSIRWTQRGPRQLVFLADLSAAGDLFEVAVLLYTQGKAVVVAIACGRRRIHDTVPRHDA